MRIQFRVLVTILCAFTFGIVSAQLSGGGDLNPDLKAPKEAQEKWMDMRVGLSVHWGPSSFGGEEISWSRNNIIPKETYDNYYKDFAPVKFDADEWAQLMNRWGIKYISPTAKHHDGFCLWFSDYSEYDMENAKLKLDLMDELSKACKKHSIVLGAYYSNLDWYHPDWAPYNYGGPGPLFEKKADSPNLERYFKFLENQCVELIEKYDLDFMQFDGEWDSTYTHEVGSRLYRRFHEVKPDILLNSRIDIGRRSFGQHNHLYMDGAKYCGDFQDRERLVKHGNNVIAWLDHPWQAWVTIDKNQWSYSKKPLLMSPEELIRDMVGVVGNNGNYMINLGPRPDGSFEAEQIALMDELGKWLDKHGEAIYGTRGGPFYPFKQGVSTRKGKKAWLMITDPEAKSIYLPKLEQEIVSLTVYGSKEQVTFSDENDNWLIPVGEINYPGPVKVIELRFKETVQMSTIKKELSDNDIQKAKKPNIVLFMVDDMGWQDTSLPFWKEETHFNKRYQTPNMEGLAKEGMMFTQAYACAVCSPTRVSLMTGMNAAHHRVTNWTLRKDEMPVRPPKGLTMPLWNMNGIGVDKSLNNAIYTPQPLPKVLQENGYTTIHCGKAHFGAIGTKAEDPKNIGFTVNIAGHAAGGPASYYGTENFATKEPSVWDIPGLEEYHGKDIFLTEALTLEAIKAVDESVKDEKPFFLYMAHYAVHAPIMGDNRFEQKYLDAGLDPIEAKYASLIEGMDKSLGDILDYVESKGLSENTIVIFMSDNGGLSVHARGGEKNSHNYPLSSGKGSIHEGGIREPMIVKWPGVVKENSSCDDYLIIEDFYPSILEMAGLEKLDGDCQPIDGKSFIHKLEGKKNQDNNRPLFWHYPNNWGPHGPGIGTYSAIRKGDWKLIYYYTNESFELFNITEDISEKNNQIKEEEKIAKQLAVELSQYLRSVEAQRPTRTETGQLIPWPDESLDNIKSQNISVIPQPLKVKQSKSTFIINKRTNIIADAASKENASYLQGVLSPAIHLKIKKKGSEGLVLKQDKTLASELGIEGYRMQVNKEEVVISAATQTGIFYGIQTLRQLLPLELKASNTTLTIPAVSITDSPRFTWRAYMLDESRYFQGEEFVKNILDEMALLKMNVFHWHLTDDAGWRIEIKKYPKLTEVGAFRKNSQVGPKKWQSEELSGEPHGGFYTQEQIKDIISYASARQITIVPEIEMPGHASAAIAAYPWLGTVGELTEVPIKFGKLPDSYNVADARVYEFIEDVLTEVMDLFPGKIIHIGGDEVVFDSWKESNEIQAFMKKNDLKSPADLQIFFTNKVSNFIDKKEHRMMGWNEILGSNVHEWQKDDDYEVKEKLANSAVIHFWKGSLDLINEAVSIGYDIVNSHHVNTYLDYNYRSIPLENAYNFDPIPTGLEKKFHKQVLGSGCQMWTEWTPTNKDVERQTFPRIAAYAEVGWTSKERKDYKMFRSNLNPILEHWTQKGIFYFSEFE